MSVEALPIDAYRDLVTRALAEDIGKGDLTSRATIDERAHARGVILAKSDLVLAGLDIAAETFRQCDPACNIALRHGDSDRCRPGTVVAEIAGLGRSLLAAERTALNFLQRLSGIATETRRYVDAAGGRITVLDTRKTTPMFRMLEKYAVRCGGGTNHRQRLDDGILIKDNHKRIAGGISAALERARAARVELPIEVEVETLDELDEAIAAGASRILVDNFGPADLRVAVERCRNRATLEVSGGVTLERIPELASTGADFVSVGALTHSVRAVDLSFEIQHAVVSQ